MKIVGHQVIYRDQRFHCAFPSIARFSDGNLLLSFRRARDGAWLLSPERRKDIDPLNRMDHIDSRSHITLLELDVHGKNVLGEPDILPIDPEAADQYGALLVLPDDTVFVSSFSWYPLPAGTAEHMAGRVPPGDQSAGCRYIYWGSHTSLRERVQGRWLAHHRYLSATEQYGRMLSPDGQKTVADPVGGNVCWRDGSLFMALYSGITGGCNLVESRDGGVTWRCRSVIAQSAEKTMSFQEPALCENGRGGFICFMRTAGADGRLATSHCDDGIHWSEPKLHNFVGCPYHPLLLADGQLLLSYGYRNKPFGVRARLLASPIDDPDDADEIIIRDDGLCPDLGYPWGVELRDGRVLITYYWTDAEGIRHIVGSWLELENK